MIVPRHAGVLSALGMLVADVTRDYSASVLRRLTRLRTSGRDRRFAPLCKARSRAHARRLHGAAAIERQLDVRYVGQSFEITLPFTATFRANSTGSTASCTAIERRAAGRGRQRAREAAGITDKPTLPFNSPRVQSGQAGGRPGRFGGRNHRSRSIDGDLRPERRAGTGRGHRRGSDDRHSAGFAFQVDGFGNVIARFGWRARRRK